MLNDDALAKLLKRNRHRVGFRMASQFLSVRLYKGNRHAIWGMTKNILEGLGGRVVAGTGRHYLVCPYSSSGRPSIARGSQAP